MMPGARSALAALALASVAAAPAVAQPVHGCMRPGQAREVLVAEHLVGPFRALNAVAASGPGDPVGIQLCLSGDAFVYDVTVLRRDGQVLHTLVDARTGAVVGAPKPAK